MRRLSVILLAILAAALLAACNQTPASPAPTEAAPTAQAAAPTAAGAPGGTGAYPAPGATGAYPAPGATGAYPAPIPEATAVLDITPVVVPQPGSNQVGVVTGSVLRILPDGTRQPIADYDIYLGSILNDTAGTPGFVRLDKNIAPRARTNGLGQFVFADVPVGQYGLMLDTVRGAILLENPNDGSDLIISVAGGDVQDLGEMAHQGLPE